MMFSMAPSAFKLRTTLLISTTQHNLLSLVKAFHVAAGGNDGKLPGTSLIQALPHILALYKVSTLLLGCSKSTGAF